MKKSLIFLLAVGIIYLLQIVFNLAVNPYITQIVVLIAINMILSWSLNLISGVTGQFSLGHAGFMAIGGYVSAFLSVKYGTILGENIYSQYALFIIFILGGGLSAAIFGFLIGMPSLRLKGDYLAIVTLGFAEIIRVVLLNMDIVGGARGYSGIPERVNFFWAYFAALVTLGVLFRLTHSMKGKAFMAVRDDEIAASSVGIPTTKIKVTAFVIGAFFAGIGGGLFAHFLAYLNPASFTFVKSVEIVVMVVCGGLGSFSGSLIASIILTSLPELLRFLNDYRMVIYSLLLIVMMILRPKGLMGMKEFGLFHRLFNSKK